MGDSVGRGGRGRKRRGPGRPRRIDRLIVRGVRREPPDWDTYVDILLQHAMRQSEQPGVRGQILTEEWQAVATYSAASSPALFPGALR